MEFTIFSSLGHYATAGAIILLGQFVYAAAGFGAGMVSVTLLVLLYGDTRLYVPLLLFVCLPTEIVFAIRDRHLVDRRRASRFLVFILPTLFAGTYLLSGSESTYLELFLGCLVVGLSLYYLFWEERFRWKPDSRWWVVPVGALSGLLGALYGMGGPPLIVYFKALGIDKRTFRANLLTLFLLTGVGRLVVYTSFSLLSWKLVASALALAPFVALGLLLGSQAHARISESRFKALTSGLLLVSGLLVIAKHVGI